MHITKPIQLSEEDQQWIFLAKHHYNKVSGYKNMERIEQAIVLFGKQYAYHPETENEKYKALSVIFQNCYRIYMKITSRDPSSREQQLREVFECAFWKIWDYESDTPVERGVAQLFSTIGLAEYLKHGVPMYTLDVNVVPKEELF